MPPQIALLRGINLGSRNRVPMPALREHLTELGYKDVRTLIASGNIILDAPAKGLAKDLQTAIADRFDVDTPVIVRTPKQLEKVVDDNPLPVPEGKRFQVLFLDRKAPALDVGDFGDERVAFAGKEIYCWHPDGVQRSPLVNALKRVDAIATARNWNTVLKLLEMTRDG